ncbi:hypothetical protein VTJ49DRAFT_1579 [Mycothermus thermophilus]|uniref:Uncharacterized protein n=1 Tax=Humicola insolens TaxID=85995 RepID=A0ABR3VPI8_HUMIN
MRLAPWSDGLPGLAVVASVLMQSLLHVSPTRAAAVPVGLSSPGEHADTGRLLRRAENEHVVLADCRDSNGVVSSQIAYFPDEPGPFPEDVAVVVTQPGQAALWINANTSGLFTDTGVTFTASLGPAVEEGQFAGTGENGYGNFSCYRNYVPRLYTYDNTECSQVYLCDHSDPPAPAPTPSGGGGLSQGSIIGIAVGATGGVLFIIAAALVYWYFRRVRGSKPKGAASDLGHTDTRTLVPSEMGGDPKPVLQEMKAIYEIDGRMYRVEMSTETGKVELDPHGHGNAELDVTKPDAAPVSIDEKPLPPSSPAVTKAVSPVTSNASDTPVTPDTPQSPPPKYSSTHEPDKTD